jgi:hypothetical protein
MLTQTQVEKFLTTLHNPRWVEPNEQGPILLDGEFYGGKLEFFASPMDIMDYGREVYQKALDGYYGEIAPYDPERNMRPNQNIGKE